VAQIVYSKRLHINMGNFEWVEIAATATLDYSVDDEEGILDDARDVVDEVLAKDIAHYNDYTAEEQSFIQYEPSLTSKDKA
jgi:hypothetical protein